MNNRSLPKPLGLSRVAPNDVVFDHYLDNEERSSRLLAACNWMTNKLWLFMPLSPPQQASCRRIMSALESHNAIDAEMAIAELILLEEPLSAEVDKHGRRI